MPEINRYLPPSHPGLPTDLVNTRRQCTACGLIYLTPRLDGASLAQVYELWYGYAYRRVMSDPEHIAERRREFERYHLRQLEAWAPGRGHLLDVGCGSGLFLGLAQRRGWKVSGVELDPATAAWGREQEGIADLRCGTLASVLRTEERFNAITLFDYLEHTDSPGDDLERLIGHLSPGGILMVRVPNASGWQAQLMGSCWLAVMPTHLSYFTGSVLRDAVASRGLDVLHLRASNYRRELDILRQRWQWFGQRLFGGTRSTAPSVEEAHAPMWPPIGNLGGAARRWLHSLWVEQVDHIGGWFGAGNNLIVIARKKTVQ